MASAKHNMGFIPEEVAHPSFWLSIFTLLELAREYDTNVYCHAVWIWDARSLYELAEKAASLQEICLLR